MKDFSCFFFVQLPCASFSWFFQNKRCFVEWNQRIRINHSSSFCSKRESFANKIYLQKWLDSEEGPRIQTQPFTNLHGFLITLLPISIYLFWPFLIFHTETRICSGCEFPFHQIRSTYISLCAYFIMRLKVKLKFMCSNINVFVTFACEPEIVWAAFCELIVWCMSQRKPYYMVHRRGSFA